MNEWIVEEVPENQEKSEAFPSAAKDAEPHHITGLKAIEPTIYIGEEDEEDNLDPSNDDVEKYENLSLD